MALIDERDDGTIEYVQQIQMKRWFEQNIPIDFDPEKGSYDYFLWEEWKRRLVPEDREEETLTQNEEETVMNEKRTWKDRFNNAKMKTKKWFDEHEEELVLSVVMLIGGACIGLIGFQFGQWDGIGKENDRWCDAIDDSANTNEPFEVMTRHWNEPIRTYSVRAEKLEERKWGEEPYEEVED